LRNPANKQTNVNENTTSLAEVTSQTLKSTTHHMPTYFWVTYHYLCRRLWTTLSPTSWKNTDLYKSDLANYNDWLVFFLVSRPIIPVIQVGT